MRGAWVLAAVAALAASQARADAIEQLHQFLVQTASARGDFVQHSPPPSKSAGKSGATGAAVTLRGNFEFLRPGRFRWTYTAPYEQLIVSDGKILYLYDKDLNQVTRKQLAGALPASPASILFGSNDFERDFHVEADGNSGAVEWIRAIPNTKDSLFELIRIGFQGGMPVAMQLRDSFGQTTELSFEHLQRNPELAAGRFEFAPPKGVDVLEEK